MNLELFIKRITKSAGRQLKTSFKNEFSLSSARSTSKGIVTKYDKIIDKLIIQEIEKNFPNHSILTEESGFIKKKEEFLWVIDSLDGTSNFANKNPLFAVSVAFYIKTEPILSAIYAPMIDEFYFAKKFNGAYLNGERIKISNIKKLQESYILYCEGNEKNKNRIANTFRILYPRVVELRKLGSASLEIAWVASGRADGYFTMKIDPWDVAAGVLLIKEAGGSVSNFKGASWQLKRDDLIFSNSYIHNNLQKILKRA